MTDEDIRKELEKIVPKSTLTEEEFLKVKELSKNGWPSAVKYINQTHTDLGLKLSKTYYDLYIDDREFN